VRTNNAVGMLLVLLLVANTPLAGASSGAITIITTNNNTNTSTNTSTVAVNSSFQLKIMWSLLLLVVFLLVRPILSMALDKTILAILSIIAYILISYIFYLKVLL